MILTCAFNLFLLICKFTTPFYYLQVAHADRQLHQGVFGGKEVIVLAYNFPPMFTYTKIKNGTYQFGGLGKEILEDAKDFFNMSIRYSVLDPVEVAKYGIWGAIYGPLIKKEVDIVPFLFYLNMETSKYMELSAAIWIDSPKIMQPWPDEESRLKATTRPFQLTVWVFFFSFNLLFIVITTCFIKKRISNHTYPKTSTTETIYRRFEYVFKIITNQGYYIPYGFHTSYKILIGFWLLSMIVLINAYFGVLTSLLTVPKLKQIVSTVKDIAESDALRLTIEKNLGVSDIFLNATSGFEKIVGDKLRQEPSLFVSSALDALENVVHHKCVYIGSDSIIGFMIHEDTKANGYCRMTASNKINTVGDLVLQIGFPIGSPYAQAFDEFILRMWACGVVSLYKHRYFPSTDQCRTDTPPKTKTRPLKLVDLLPPFFILGLGLSLSMLSFAIECFVGYLKEKCGIFQLVNEIL